MHIEIIYYTISVSSSENSNFCHFRSKFQRLHRLLTIPPLLSAHGRTLLDFFFLFRVPVAGGEINCDQEINDDSKYKYDLSGPVWVRQTWSLKNTISKLCWIPFWIPKITPEFTLLKNQAPGTSFSWKEWSLSFLPQNMRNSTWSPPKLLLSIIPCLPTKLPLPHAHLKCHLFYWICNSEENHSLSHPFCGRKEKI